MAKDTYDEAMRKAMDMPAGEYYPVPPKTSIESLRPAIEKFLADTAQMNEGEMVPLETLNPEEAFKNMLAPRDRFNGPRFRPEADAPLRLLPVNPNETPAGYVARQILKGTDI